MKRVGFQSAHDFAHPLTTLRYFVQECKGIVGCTEPVDDHFYGDVFKIICKDGDELFIKTEIDAGEEELAIFRVRIPAFMAGSSTTLVVAAQRS